MTTPTLTTIHLVGSLGRAVGHYKLEMDVFSVGEAVRAIDIVTDGKLSQYLRGPGKDKYYKVALQKRDNVVDKEELTHRSGRSTIWIIPTIRGRNSSGGKILAGIAILALTYFTGGLAVGAAGWMGATATAASPLGIMAIGFGVSLLLGGITQLLTPKPQGPAANEEMAQSTSFQGNATAVVQGGPVPIVYGRMLVPALPISITISNNTQQITNAGTLGTVDSTDLQGGGTEDSPGG